MIAILTEEQIQSLTYKQCKDALKALNKTYPLDKPASELTKEEWALCDPITNTLLYLEDRIHQFEDSRIPSMDPMATIVRPVKKEPDPAKAKRPARKFSMQGVVYESLRAASLKTGIKVGTLQTYVSRKPDQYFYIDN
jgi:hypothetical protein